MSDDFVELNEPAAGTRLANLGREWTIDRGIGGLDYIDLMWRGYTIAFIDTDDATLELEANPRTNEVARRINAAHNAFGVTVPDKGAIELEGRGARDETVAVAILTALHAKILEEISNG